MAQQDTDLATHILNHMGGGEFAHKAGAREFAAITGGLKFRISSRASANNSNLIRILKTDEDQYDLHFSKAHGGNEKEKGSVTGLRAEDLSGAFEESTGIVVT